MSDLTPAEKNLLAWHTLPCRYAPCAQPVGRRCVAPSGERTTPHVARLDDLDIYLMRQPEVDALLAQLTSLRASNDQLVSALKTSDDKLDMAMQRLANLQLDLTHAQADLADYKASHPDVPPTPKTLFGFWPGGSAATPKDEDGNNRIDWFDDYVRVARYLGPPEILRNFQGGSGLGVIPKSWMGTRMQVLGLKAFVESYTKAPYDDWISGKALELVIPYLDSIPEDVHAFVGPHHEPRPEWTTEMIIKVWKLWLAEVPKKPNLHPTHVPMGFDWTAKRFDESELVDGIEVLAPDIYLTHGTPEEIFAPSVATAKKHGLRYGVSEYAKAQKFLLPGMTDDQTSVALVEYATLELPRLIDTAYVTLFESNKSDGNWLLQDDTAAVSAWATR